MSSQSKWRRRFNMQRYRCTHIAGIPVRSCGKFLVFGEDGPECPQHGAQAIVPHVDRVGRVNVERAVCGLSAS